jgi:hypothetical protein
MACSAHGRSFSLKTSELSQLSGITLRQFQHWDERGILRPRRAMGKCGPDMRVYGEREVFGALLRRECIRSGASVRWIGRCLPDIVDQIKPEARYLLICAGSFETVDLLEDLPVALSRLCKAKRAPCAFINLCSVRDEAAEIKRKAKALQGVA